MTINCAVCGSDDAVALFKKKDYSIVKCKKDSHIYVQNAPSLSELAQIYSEDYFHGRGEIGYHSDVMANTERQQRKAARKLERVKDFASSGKILDVGCGPGFFLYKSKENFEIEGLDISRAAAAYALSELDVPVHISDFMDFKTDKKYDIITMFSYLEHTLDPRANLKRAHELLTEKGFLVLSIPNVNGLTAKIMGQKWRGFEIPEHIHFFNTPNMQEILRQTGFEYIGPKLKDNNFLRDTNYYFARKI